MDREKIIALEEEEATKRQAEYDRYRERLDHFDSLQRKNREGLVREAPPLPFRPVLDNIGARNDRALEAALDEYLKKRVDKIEEKE